MSKVRMKEINTPLKLFKVRYYKAEDGQYYKKVGGEHRQPVKPFWKKKRVKLGIPLLLLIVLGFVGYQVGMNLASDKVVEELSTQIPEKDIQALLTDPTIQQTIEDEVGADKKQQILDKYSVDTLANTPLTASTSNKTGSSTTIKKSSSNQGDSQALPTKNDSKLKFTSRDQVMRFLLSKFTMKELLSLADKAKSGITPEVKSEIKATVMQRLTTEEYNAIKIYAIIELSN